MERILSFCNTCMDSVLTSSKCKQPWINNEIKRLTCRKQQTYYKGRHSNSPADWTKYYELKQECQRECHTAFNKYVSNHVDPNKNTVTEPL